MPLHIHSCIIYLPHQLRPVKNTIKEPEQKFQIFENTHNL
ncbi:hypothetical protein C4K18_5515 [Pseudomonas chlororaphis subsp. aurantiaca]|nr:hypothetical protein C4K18_5515 [Pseudomonas chlororaphis subsp. aurantiaca]